MINAQNVPLSTGFQLINFNQSGKGFAFGKVSEIANAFENALATYMYNIKELRFKEEGYGDKFAIIPAFNGLDDGNLLKIMASVGGAGTDPELYDIAILTAKSGHFKVKGKLGTGLLERNTTDTWIPVLRDGYLDYTLRRMVSNISHTNHPYDQDTLATMNFLSFWNGAYDNEGHSNLKHCADGSIFGATNVYWNANGTNGTVVLGDNAENWHYCNITYRNDDWQWGSTGLIVNPNGKAIGASISRNNADNTILLENSALFHINGNVITIDRNRQTNFSRTGGNSIWDDPNSIYITCVEFFKHV